MARLFLLPSLISAGIALAQSTCPDGKQAGSVGFSGGGYFVCCPGTFAVRDGTGPHGMGVTCTHGCSHPTRTVCGSTTLTDVSTTLPTSASPSVTGSSAAATSTTCSGASCLPPGCSTKVDYGHQNGVCSIADFFQPGYLSSVYGTLAGTSTFGAGPTSAMAARITDAPQMMAVAGALAGLALF